MLPLALFCLICEGTSFFRVYRDFFTLHRPSASFVRFEAEVVYSVSTEIIASQYVINPKSSEMSWAQ